MASTSSSSTVGVVSSTLTRPRVAFAIVSAVSAASLGYYLYITRPSSHRPESLPVGPPLRRSNALRRNRARGDDAESDSESPNGGADENLEALQVLRERVEIEDQPNTGMADLGPWDQDDRQRTGENIVGLLFRVSEDNARRNAYVHRGCQCNGCGAVPIRGIRYRCANCSDFDLCEICESQGYHNRAHVFYKVRIPAPPFVPRQVQPPWYPGDPETSIRNLPRHLLAKWSNETGFERVELDAFWEQWTFMANTEWRDDPSGLCLAMDRKTFERCLVPSGGYRYAAPNLIHDRMFSFYDTNHDDLIGFEEFLQGVAFRKRKDKLRRTFEGYDIDGDGYVNRRDFLRMFRAYYVLYKQMHSDILEGLDEHMMTTTEAEQLITSRAPLSSLFGREGRVPDADQTRFMEGKVFRDNGDVYVADGRGVVNEDKPDTAGREEILNSLFARNPGESLFTETFSTSSRRPTSPDLDARYVSGIINPPQNLADLTALISGERNQLGDILDSLRQEDQVASGDEKESVTSSDDNEGYGDGEQHSSHTQDQTHSSDGEGQDPALAGTGDEPEQPIPDAPRFTPRLNEEELRAEYEALKARSVMGTEKRKRIQARKQLLERWKRRQFYLDEEEGASAPSGWDDGQDVLANVNGVAESSKSAPRVLSPRSRSSSKVRFAEDTDDYETRSNPSTSSRSVPERWGGMEIPDAERDAGKEILYQVTQQAFNELLDDIFKRKEDIAIRAAETKSQREKYRHLLDAINLDDDDDCDDDDDDEEDEESEQAGPENMPATAAFRPTAPPDVAMQDRSLEQLLSFTGYTVVPENSSVLNGTHANGIATSGSSPHEPTVDITTTELADPEGMVDTEARPSTSSTITELPTQRDPTMPQFRPNSLSDCPQGVKGPEAVAENGHAHEKLSNGLSTSSRAIPAQNGHLDKGKGIDHSVESKLVPRSSDSHVPRATLYTWKRLDEAEQEARERGGWGKLSFEEFEAIYREHEFSDSARNRLDYLGSWIDFCIPYSS